MVERWVLGGQTVVFGYVLWYDMLYIRTYGCSFPFPLVSYLFTYSTTAHNIIMSLQ